MDLKLLFEIIWNYIIYLISGIFTVGTFVGVFRLLRGWNKHKKEIKVSHSKDLVKELKISMDSEVVFSSDENSFKLDIKPKMNVSLISSHLEDRAYRDLRENIKRRNFFIIKVHNMELQEFLNRLNLKIMGELTQKIPEIIEWDEFSGQPKLKKYYTKYLKSEVEGHIQFRYENYYGKRDPFTVNIGRNGIWRELYITSHPLVAGDDEIELQEIREMIIKNFNVAINSEWFKILMLYLDDIREDHNLIKEELIKVIEDVNDGGLLKGNCEQCPSGDSLWRYTWQRIEKYLQ